MTKYARKPTFGPGTFNDLYDSVLHFTLEDVLACAKELGVQGQGLRTYTGNELTIEDIVCIEGTWKPAKDSNRYYFYGGPERSTDGSKTKSAFVMVYGTLLDWLVDAILFQMTYRGWSVMQKLGIPL